MYRSHLTAKLEKRAALSLVKSRFGHAKTDGTTTEDNTPQRENRIGEELSYW
jgi:hypothetical protein